jgi:4-diphosphocytidyl-2-C-methyl-D-erythritol kinase
MQRPTPHAAALRARWGKLGGSRNAVTAFAPAKLNLCLHVTGRRADGYHELDSLVAFADIGDRIEAAPAPGLSLVVEGRCAAQLADIGDDNLVLRAARSLAAAAGITEGAALRLEKNLPVAAGLGGGSSDAAAALRALAALWRLPFDRAALAALAAPLGADLPVCVHAGPAWVGGIGERIEPLAALPEAGIVLANPRTPLSTAAVFRARQGPFGAAARFAPMPSEAAGLAAALAGSRNDLADAAIALAPPIAAVLDRLACLPGALLARMSGSGATCFALFADRAAAAPAGRALAAAEPGWWCAAGALVAGGFIAEPGHSR